ncbi:SPW repeat protein [Limimaricola hongkongensis]|uniref:SPW repeat-containing integral membrane domain-containing protein n=1 Tax=Limimaricola hongkongensis DSM 17492 TaxID=1122180 RepID=A0A017HG19_9RHOB|nr:SPW repeat protein [Limimaricola hongkongensis]EYD72739.1 hypothetical protein Lokhon_01543 [Limimaricola hongkongensis DSM 17492]
MTHRHHWQDWIYAAIGAWLVVSPWFLGMAGGALWVLVALGAIVVALAATAMMRESAQDGADFAVAVFAVLIVATPWVLGFSGTGIAAWNPVICGLVLAVAALWTHLMPHEGGHA